ncbi:MAG TPA: hypothetical protein VGZ47_19405 [Gemmataceae bacterium]|jgi:hypothetical protein|nr:hypothetical protein [Gemmataceae bacterium]
MRVGAAILVLLAVSSLPALAQKPKPPARPAAPARPGEITADDLVQKGGTIAELTKVKSGKIKLELKGSESEKNELFHITHQTMVYKLSERNREIFKEQDKLADIAKDANKVRARLKELPEAEQRLQQSQWERLYVDGWGRATYHAGYSQGAANNLSRVQLAWKHEEQERQDRYGPRVTLIKGLEVIVIADKGNDLTYAVLVIGKIDPSKESKEGAKSTTSAIVSPSEQEAKDKLNSAKLLLDQIKSAKGADKSRLIDSAEEKLKDVIKKFPQTEAAKEAEELLKELQKN